jgi:vacuolar protein sorting-associated protein 26
VDIKFKDANTRKKIDVKRESSTESLYLFVGKESVVGNVSLKLNPGKKIEHAGVKIELLGQIGKKDSFFLIHFLLCS